MEQSAAEMALARFTAGDYPQAAELLEQVLASEPENLRAKIGCLTARALAHTPVKGEALRQTWGEIRELLESCATWEIAEEARQAVSILANTVYRNCNDWQKMEYAALQKDVNFEKKEYVLQQFQRILLAADVEYRAVLEFLYGYAALARQMLDGAPEDFVRGAVKNMLFAAELQYEIGLQEEFDPLILAGYVCEMDLSALSDGEELRQELLKATLHGEHALARWEEFAPYAPPELRRELEKEVRKARFVEKLQFWKRLKKKVRS